MPRQPAWPVPASRGPGATAAPAAGPPNAGQPARLRLLPGARQRHEERPRPLVVFLGVGDDRRSRLAAALLAYRARGRVQAISVSPVTLDPGPVVLRAFADIGIDLLACRSRPPSTELLRRAAVVVVMGYVDRAPDGGTAPAEDWCIDDPCGKDPETMRYIRDAIDRRVQRLLVRLGGAGPSSPTAGGRS